MDFEIIDNIKKLKFKVSDLNDSQIIANKNDNSYKITVTGNKYRLEHLYSDFVLEDIDEDELLENLSKQSGYFTYACGFGVTGFIIPKYWYSAQAYLKENDMIKYYDGSQKDDIKSIMWELTNKQKGRIYIETISRLTRDGLNDLKDFIDGQNSDGLGECFEQQEFIRMQKPGETIVAGNIFKYSGFESTK